MHKVAKKSFFFITAFLFVFSVNIAFAEIVNPLNAASDGSSGSVESTFGNPAIGHSTAPAGWSSVGTYTIDVYKKTGMNAALCVTWPSTGYNYTYTAQFTTSIPPQAYTQYSLSLLAGSHENWETGMADYTFILGTIKNSVFTQIGTSDSLRVVFYNSESYIAENKGTYLNRFYVQTGVTVPEGNLAIRISVTSYGVAWPAIDNVLLQTNQLEFTCTAPVEGDMNNDCIVDFCDFAIFMENWMRCTLTPNLACDN